MNLKKQSSKPRQNKKVNPVKPGVVTPSDASIERPVVTEGEGLPLTPAKATTFRRSAFLADEMLRSHYNDATKKVQQLALFPTLPESLQSKILSSGVTPEIINRNGLGVTLARSEYKLVLCLQQLLHEKSQTFDASKPGFYGGNKGYEIIAFDIEGEKVNMVAPKIGLSLYEIAKTYHGGGEIGGSAVKLVADLLTELNDNPAKRCLMNFKLTVDKGNGIEREYFIKRYEPLITLEDRGYIDRVGSKEIDHHSEQVIILHPIFSMGLDKKYIKTPADIILRLTEAYGSEDLPEAVQKLVNYLERALSSPNTNKAKEFKTEIGKKKLFSILCPTQMKKGDMGYAQRAFDKAVGTAKKIGLLLNYEVKQDRNGGDKFVFTLNKDYL